MSGLSWKATTAVVQSAAPLLLVGMTVLLALGCLLVRFTRSPVHRQRLGEMTLVAVLAWSLLALLPLPRLLPEFQFMSDSAANSVIPGHVVPSTTVKGISLN